MYEIKSKRLRSQILTYLIFTVLFSKISRFHGKKQPCWKDIVIVEEELDYIDIDDIGKLENLSILEFIDEECGNLTENLLKILTIRRSLTFYNTL